MMNLAPKSARSRMIVLLSVFPPFSRSLVRMNFKEGIDFSPCCWLGTYTRGVNVSSPAKMMAAPFPRFPKQA